MQIALVYLVKRFMDLDQWVDLRLQVNVVSISRILYVLHTLSFNSLACSIAWADTTSRFKGLSLNVSWILIQWVDWDYKSVLSLFCEFCMFSTHYSFNSLACSIALANTVSRLKVYHYMFSWIRISGWIWDYKSMLCVYFFLYIDF